jgi:hypothetical protein
MSKMDALEHIFNALGHLMTGAENNAREREAAASAAAKRRRRRQADTQRAPGNGTSASFGSGASEADCCLGQRKQFKVKRIP